MVHNKDLSKVEGLINVAFNESYIKTMIKCLDEELNDIEQLSIHEKDDEKMNQKKLNNGNL